MRLRELLRSDESSIGDIARVVMLDPLLASKVMQVANSAALNPAGAPVNDIPAAVLRIGSNNVRNLAMAIAMQQLRTYKEMKPYDQMCDRFLQHCRQVAAICFVLAREFSRVSPDTAMFAGLVHDIGLFYLTYRVAGRADFQIEHNELLALLTDWHGSIGHAVLSAMGIPENIQAAVAHHGEPRQVDQLRELGDILYVGNQLARRAGVDNTEFEFAEELADEATIRDFPRYVETLAAKADEIAAIANNLS
jgi:HD-like signal output (HDOD) protein